MRVTQKTRRLFIFPSISHLGGIEQGGISREIPPWHFPDNTGLPDDFDAIKVNYILL